MRKILPLRVARRAVSEQRGILLFAICIIGATKNEVNTEEKRTAGEDGYEGEEGGGGPCSDVKLPPRSDEGQLGQSIPQPVVAATMERTREGIRGAGRRRVVARVYGGQGRR